ncbi:MAG TPA: circadian clock protein KaiC [Pyrinomonadaceae bacterium]
MPKPKNNSQPKNGPTSTLPKAPTGITGLDEITEGGLPKGRPTLICGSAGCGKTLMAMEFLVRGAADFNEPGVFFAFEEMPEELSQNVMSLGFDLKSLERKKKLHLEYVHIEPSEMQETGEYDLEGLFIRLGYAIDTIGAKRVVLDTIETLFGGLSNQALLRAELRRLFRWLKDRGVTAVITGERGEGTLTRQGLEEYVSDCVILLDHRVIDQVSTRRLRIIKYRGTTHGTNEYPFLIDERGIDVLPVTSLRLDHESSDERVSTGVPELDSMLDGGVYRGSSVLISGTAGTGKSSLAAHFARESAEAGERCLYLAFEESPSQIRRNMRSIGIDLGPWERKGLIRFVAARPVLTGLEGHLAAIHKQVRDFDPKLVIIDPISDLSAVGSERDAKAMMVRLIDFLKTKQITTVLINLHSGANNFERTDIGISSLIDTWIYLRDIESGGERNRGLYVLKSRGTAHSNQIREFLLTNKGIELVPAYIGPEGVLTGSARLTQESRDRASAVAQEQELQRQRRAIEGRRKSLEAQIEALRSELEIAAAEEKLVLRQDEDRQTRIADDRDAMARSRRADLSSSNGKSRRKQK